MEEAGDHLIHGFYFVKFRPSPEEAEKEEAVKQYQLMTFARSRNIQDVHQRKADEHEINQKLIWISGCDKRIDYNKWKIKNLEAVLGEVKPNSLPITTDFVHFRKRLIKKDRMDVEYLQQVQEQLLSSKKARGMTSCGAEELHHLMKSMAHRIQHGNNNRSNEMKIFNEMRNVKETTETYTAPEPDPPFFWYPREPRSKRHTDWKRSMQLRINNWLDDIEALKRDKIEHKARVPRLKEKLDLVRKSICSLQKELEDVNTKRIQAYKLAYELGEQTKEVKSCYGEYQSLITYAKELAVKGDIVGLKQACDTQVEGFMKQWSNSKAFRDDCERRR